MITVRSENGQKFHNQPKSPPKGAGSRPRTNVTLSNMALGELGDELSDTHAHAGVAQEMIRRQLRPFSLKMARACWGPTAVFGLGRSVASDSVGVSGALSGTPTLSRRVAITRHKPSGQIWVFRPRRLSKRQRAGSPMRRATRRGRRSEIDLAGRQECRLGCARLRLKPVPTPSGSPFWTGWTQQITSSRAERQTTSRRETRTRRRLIRIPCRRESTM